MSLNADLDLTMDQLVQLTQAVLTAVPSPAVKDGWQPIETAPKDGTVIALRRGQRVYGGRWGQGTYNTGWLLHDSDIMFAFSPLDPPTRWMPLDSDVPVQHKEQS